MPKANESKSNVFDGQADEVFAQAHLVGAAGDDDPKPALLIDVLIQHIKGGGVTDIGHVLLLDFDGIKDAVLLDDQINFGFDGRDDSFLTLLKCNFILANNSGFINAIGMKNHPFDGGGLESILPYFLPF